VEVGVSVVLVLACMYVSKRLTTSLTLAFIFATSASTVARIVSSCGTDAVGASTVAASASERVLFLVSRLAT
jgi:hypothetical protein